MRKISYLSLRLCFFSDTDEHGDCTGKFQEQLHN